MMGSEVGHGTQAIYAEFKLETVKLVTERGVAVKQAARDLNVHENIGAKWGEGFFCRSAACVSWQGPNEARRSQGRRVRLHQSASTI
jgi:transposase